MDKLDEIGQMLVSRALDLTQKIRKIAADIFAKSGLEKPRKKEEQLDFSLDCHRVSRGLWPITGY